MNKVFDEASLEVDLTGQTFVNSDFVDIDFSTRVYIEHQFRNCQFHNCSNINTHQLIINGNSVYDSFGNVV